jgi:hypothetical protein
MDPGSGYLHRQMQSLEDVQIQWTRGSHAVQEPKETIGTTVLLTPRRVIVQMMPFWDLPDRLQHYPVMFGVSLHPTTSAFQI